MFWSSKVIVLGLLTGIAGLVATGLPFGFSWEEDIGLDLLFRLRGSRPVPPEVIVVSIDKQSADYLDLPARPEKWPRNLHARLTDTLARGGASVIAFDIFFDEARTPAYDAELAAAIRRARNVVLVESLKRQTIEVPGSGASRASHLTIEQVQRPIAVFAQTAVALAPFPLPKVPVKLSQYWKFKTSAGDMPTLPVVVFQLFALDVYDEFVRLLAHVKPAHAGRLPHDATAVLADGQVAQLVRTVRALFASDPDAARQMLDEAARLRGPPSIAQKRQRLVSLIKMYQGDETEYLNFYGPPRSIPTVPYYQLVRDNFSVMPTDIKGKAVFVGSLDQKDGVYTVYSQPNGLDISGVEIAATAFANLAEGYPIRPLGPGPYMAMLLLWGLAVGALCSWSFAPVDTRAAFRYYLPRDAADWVLSASSVVAAGMLYLLVAMYRFSSAGEWYPLVLPLLVQIPVAFVGGRLVPRSSETVYAVCLLTDVKDYTKVGEGEEMKRNPASLLQLVNKYLKEMFKVVRRHGGEVSDMKGDSVLTAWGNANRDKVPRRKACLAACDVKRAVERFNKGAAEDAKMPTRVGLHFGLVERGFAGGFFHRELRLFGDTVNTTERIDRVNKEMGTWITASPEVLDGVDGLLTRELGTFLLPGKSTPLLIHEVICRDHEADPWQRTLCERFAEALRLYRSRCLEDAKSKFLEAGAYGPKDEPAQNYADACSWYVKNPGDWNGGVVDLSSGRPLPWMLEREYKQQALLAGG